MKPAAILAGLGLTVLAAGSASAQIPFFNATCGKGIEIHADEGGPIYINGNESRITVSNSTYYEAHHGHLDISVSINPDGSPSVSYTGKGGANGICQLTDGSGGGCPPDVSEADRSRYPACN